MMRFHPRKEIKVLYTNWKGNQRMRTIIPLSIWFGKTKYHPVEQWLLQVYDEELILKDFAMKDCIFGGDINAIV